MAGLPSIDDLRKAIAYDPETGVFTRTSTGRPTGTKTMYGYIQIGVAQQSIRAHRLAFALQTGAWPKGVIDHINGVRDDNRWSNLRDVEPVVNSHNLKGASRRNKLGVLGVHQDRGKFKVVMNAFGRSHFIGRFATLDEAQQAHAQAKQRLHPQGTL